MSATSIGALRKLLFGHPVVPWRVVPVAALVLWLPESFENWSVNVQLTGVLGYLAGGAVVWLCCTRLEPFFDRHGVTSRAARLLAGMLAIVLGIWGMYALDSFILFPALNGGRYMEQHVFWQWGIHVTTMALLVHGWHVLYRARSASDDELRRASDEMDMLDATLANAELALLSAQVEPHFLFNTLAHVKRDLKHAPRLAEEMLDALIVYLERAAPALRRADWSIADELDLVGAYLGILQQRFGERLRFSIDAPQAWRAVRLPALAVATLVENAVTHGLAPQPRGGTVRIEVKADVAGVGGGVRIDVVDDGVGLTPTQGKGLGLATVRARLRAAFGARAALTLEPDAPAGQRSGVRASIRIPHHA